MNAEAIYKGATRPAMKMGIPLVPLVIIFGAALMAAMWGGVLVSGWIALAVLAATAPMLVWMRLVTAHDDQRFHQIFLALKLWLHDRNRPLWQARSYAPTLYKGARDAWHR